MGTQELRQFDDPERQRAFMRALLADVRALERMLDEDRLESGIKRIGVEQEMFLVDKGWHPAPVSDKVLEILGDDHFTTELARFNMEFNVDPIGFGGDCLRQLERTVQRYLRQVREAAAKVDARVLLTGILPSLAKGDLGMHNISENPRYYALNDALGRLRNNRPYQLSINGVDELIYEHDTVMLEACNTSFQVHFQVDPSTFARHYNTAQAVAGPVLAACVNSPLLFGRRLWRETRIALFQQSVDTRTASSLMRESIGRVSFGTRWVEDSVLDLFHEDITRFKTLFSDVDAEDSIAVLDSGVLPKLKALCMHNGTVYRWMRACYGSDGETAHLRIENRVIPSGPTPRDEIATSALWFGLMRGVEHELGDVKEIMQFEDVLANFESAARHGLEAQLVWPGVGHAPAQQVLLEQLIPLARRGLESSGIDHEDIGLYLDVIEERVRTGMTGANWQLRSLAALQDTIPSRGERLAVLTGAMWLREEEGLPVHEWTLADAAEVARDRSRYMRVGQFMTTDLFTVNESDVIDLVASIMDWKHVRHIPVEDDDHRLVGLVSHRLLLRHLAGSRGGADGGVAVSAVMTAEPVTATPETPTLEAMRLMRDNRIGCLPVVEEGRLVGVVTEHDLVQIAAPLLEEFLQA
jgi:CBS domain-containing protein